MLFLICQSEFEAIERVYDFQNEEEGELPW
jgi:hypothetical protein